MYKMAETAATDHHLEGYSSSVRRFIIYPTKIQ